MKRILWVSVTIGGVGGVSAIRLASGESALWWIGAGLTIAYLVVMSHYLAYTLGATAELGRRLGLRK